MIATMAINEVRAAHEMYEALLAREYNFTELIADIAMEMNCDIINTIHAVKSTEVEFDMCKYHERFDNLLYKVHSILMIAGYIDRSDVEEMISNIENQFIKSIDNLVEEYMKPE
jgi:hypothetical protein